MSWRHKLKTKIINWIESPYDYDEDLFGCHIRETWQRLFPCKHQWKETTVGRRHCLKCNQRQYLGWKRYPPRGCEWTDIPTSNTK